MWKHIVSVDTRIHVSFVDINVFPNNVNVNCKLFSQINDASLFFEVPDVNESPSEWNSDLANTNDWFDKWLKDEF